MVCFNHSRILYIFTLQALSFLLVFWKKSLGLQTKIQNLRPALFLVYLEKTMYLKPMKPTLIVLTGAVSGIGRALFSTFSQRQIPMILLDLEEEKLKKMAEGLPFVDWVAGSVAEPSTWATVLEKGSKSGFIISHLINCAGVIRPGFLEGYALEDIDFHLDCNTKGSILGTTLVGRWMKKQHSGHIINISPFFSKDFLNHSPTAGQAPAILARSPLASGIQT